LGEQQCGGEPTKPTDRKGGGTGTNVCMEGKKEKAKKFAEGFIKWTPKVAAPCIIREGN